MIGCFGEFRDSGDYSQVDLVQAVGTGKKVLTCWLPAKDVERVKAAGSEITLKGQEGRWKIGAVYGTKPRDFIATNKMERASFDREGDWTW